MYRSGYEYAKAGVMLSDLESERALRVMAVTDVMDEMDSIADSPMTSRIR